jgi:hypothetical protein
MDTAAFLASLKLRAKSDIEYADPLPTAVLLVQLNPHTAECRALRKLLNTLSTTQGVFRESEAWLFSGEISGLTAALIDARLEGRYSDEEWQRACLS